MRQSTKHGMMVTPGGTQRAILPRHFPALPADIVTRYGQTDELNAAFSVSINDEELQKAPSAAQEPLKPGEKSQQKKRRPIAPERVVLLSL